MHTEEAKNYQRPCKLEDNGVTLVLKEKQNSLESYTHWKYLSKWRRAFELFLKNWGNILPEEILKEYEILEEVLQTEYDARQKLGSTQWN